MISQSVQEDVNVGLVRLGFYPALGPDYLVAVSYVTKSDMCMQDVIVQMHLSRNKPLPQCHIDTEK